MRLQTVAELLARKTGRRGLIGRGAGAATGLLLGAAAGGLAGARTARAGAGTVCDFPNRPCPCEGCHANTGTCNKPCILYNYWYASGCWVTGSVTCCDCDCGSIGAGICGCGTDYHGNTCP